MKKDVRIDAYIKSVPKESQPIVEKIRNIIHRAAPEGEEAFSYGVPTIKVGRKMVNFAAFKNHIGLYPGPTTINVFKKELNGYDLSKGTIRFPLEKKIPFTLISRIVSHSLGQKK